MALLRVRLSLWDRPFENQVMFVFNFSFLGNEHLLYCRSLLRKHSTKYQILRPFCFSSLEGLFSLDQELAKGEVWHMSRGIGPTTIHDFCHTRAPQNMSARSMAIITS